MCMKKIYLKLIALSLMLAVSVVMVITVSYAWVIMSTSPEVSGLQVTIGGGNTILVAADLTGQADGATYHYPDVFRDKLNFSSHASYAYLQDLDGLMPVSTADGIHWFLPEYYEASDAAVRNGLAAAGQIKDISQFTLEQDLAHANLSGVEEDVLAQGSYIFLDFWVVSPGTDCTLRLSVPTVEGDNSGGTFLVEQLQVRNGTDGPVLRSVESNASAMFRVGFLANDDMVLDDSMRQYLQSPGYDDEYRSLRGTYGEPGDYQYGWDSTRFTIYEPNADFHPELPGMEGKYLLTSPVGLVEDAPREVSVKDRVTAQRRSDWLMLDNGQTMLEQIFQSAIFGREDLEPQKLTEFFYNTYLQGQVEPFVNKGAFVKRAENLVDGLELTPGLTAGATDDVYIIRLQRDTPQRIRMFVWLEGQDADCTNVTQATSVMLNLELAGSTTRETAGQ